MKVFDLSMKSRKGGSHIAVVALLVSFLGGAMADAGDHPHNEEAVLNFHGSGTTNPSRCYWAIMQQFEERTKHPIRATYRAVGSTTGIEEFVNGYDPFVPASDFSSGDLPLNNTVYRAFQDADIEVLHLPVLLGAVSFFHSVPVQRLNLTGCLLARIFDRKITDWTAKEITDLNPELRERQESFPIRVARRVRGSSSTDAVTNYLFDSCPEHWTEDKTGPLISWDADTVGCEGSGGMTDCINEEQGTIGYIDAGHGNSAGLAEIELENRDGTLLSSQEASAEGGIDAAEEGVMPAAADFDFSGVSLLNRPGKYTWPLVQMTYIYVRRNITFLAFPDEQTLMVAFLRALYEDEYVQQCVKNYGFTRPSASTRQLALDGIDSLLIHPDAHDFAFETSTLPVDGTDYYLISSKRKRIASIIQSGIQDDVETLREISSVLRQEMNEQQFGMTDDQERQLKAALVLSSLSFIMCFLIFCLLGKNMLMTKFM